MRLSAAVKLRYLWTAFAAASFALTSATAATLTVTNPGDTHVDGQTTLREAIAASAAGEVVNFAVAGQVKLTAGELKSLTT